MKKILRLLTTTALLLVFTTGQGWGQTKDAWTEDFDSQTSNSYASTAITINGRIWTRSDAGNFSYANTNMGSYAFTINDDRASAHITTPSLNTCGTVGFKYAYINGSETNVFVLQKSTNGTDFTDLETHTLGASSNLSYVDYSYDVNDASSTVYIRILSDNQNAHLFIEDYSVTNYTGSGPDNPTSFTATASSASQIDLAFASNAATDNVVIAYNGTGTFTAPSGPPPAVGQAFAGGTLLYNGTSSPQNHTGLTSGETVYYKAWSYDNTDYSTGLTDDATTLSPTITLSETALTGFTYVEGSGPSAEQTFTVEGSNLTADISIAATTNYEISKTSGTGWATPLTFTQTSGTVATQTVYVRLKDGLSAGDYNNEDITASSTGATSKIVTCSGTVTSAGGSGCASDLIISEVNENGNEKYIEIANFTGASVSLADYDVVIYSNGSTSVGSTIDLTDASSIADEDVWVLANSSSSAWTGTPDQTSGSFSPNGNDVIALRKSSTNIDVFGTIGSSAYFYDDQTVIRNSDITAPTTTYSASAWTFTAYTGDDPTTLGSHTMDCSGTGPDNPTAFSATASGSDQIDLIWTENGDGNDVLIAWSSDGTFGTPVDGTTYASSASIPGGGTSLGTDADEAYSHTSLTSNTLYYYRIWSVDGSTNYSSGIEANATTDAVEPSNHPTDFTATSNSSSEITVTWTDAASTEQYLIKGSDLSYAAIAAPIDGVAESNSLLVQNVAQGVQTHPFTSLTASTTYYFKIYPYNGTGTTINYKTDGTVPEDDASTGAYTGAQLLISEVSDPSDVADAKFVEIYNAGTTAVDFSSNTWYLCRQANGSTTSWGDVQLTGSISAGGKYVVAYNTTIFTTSYSFAPSQTNGFISGNGDDGYFLYFNGTHTTGTLVDAYGVIDEDGTGQPWEYTNSKAVRNNTITSPNGTWTASEWTIVSSCDAARMTPAMHPASAWNGNAAKSSDWTNAGNWDNGLTASGISAHIPSGLTVYPTLTASATIEDLRMGSGTTLLGGENLTIEGSAVVQKTIAEYTSSTDGWNVISAPVNGMAMAGSDFVPVIDEDDLYAYDQLENIWRNYNDGSNPTSWFDNFDVGTGYLVAYATDNAGIKNFTAALNTNASYAVSIANSNTSWNLIGNPYPSNITWADVTLTNASSPKVINTSTGAWDDIGTILETGQGVFVYAESGGANVTFDRADQTHTASSKKAMTTNPVNFIADFGGKSVSLALIVNETATQSYEWQHDARYLYPVTTIPYLCAITEDDVWVSKYAFGSQNLETTIIPLYFQVSNEQSITFSLDNFSKEMSVEKITLEDKSNGNLEVLSDGNSYTYQASPDDQTDRFILHVETVTSIYENTQLDGVSIYGYDNNIYIRSELNTSAKVLVYNMLGKEVYHSSMELNGLQSFKLNAKTGWYIVHLVAEKGVKTEKVFVK